MIDLMLYHLHVPVTQYYRKIIKKIVFEAFMTQGFLVLLVKSTDIKTHLVCVQKVLE